MSNAVRGCCVKSASFCDCMREAYMVLLIHIGGCHMTNEKMHPKKIMNDCESEKELFEKYDFYNYNHAMEIIKSSFTTEWGELKEALMHFETSIADIKSLGGNKSAIPKKFDNYLFDKKWEEVKIVGSLNVNVTARSSRRGKYRDKPDQKILPKYIDGHNIDFVKDRVAFDIEWNSKDQTFDRDLLAMRTYYECDLISVGIILTRAEELNEIFDTLYFRKNDGKYYSVMKKYGASTTWVGKLLPRLDSRRNGGCPILVIGIKQQCVKDWYRGYIDPEKPGDETLLEYYDPDAIDDVE